MTNQVAAATHEAGAWLYYAPVESGGSYLTDYDGLDPYWSLASLILGSFDGYRELEGVEINGEEWDVRVNYSQSGFRPRPEDDIDGDRLYEFDINVRGRDRRKCNYNVSPRFPDMRKSDGEGTTTAFHHTDPDSGVSIHCESSNMRFDEIPALLPRFIAELAEDAGTSIYHGYFESPFDGRITAVERYVRLTRSMNEKLIANGGVLDRLSMHLSDVSGTKGQYKWDNEEVRGHHHVLRHGSTSARQMCSQHRLGGQIKSYLPQHPENFEAGDPLYHPKLGTKYLNGRTKGSAVQWADRDEVRAELDERLLSILTWADIHVDAGGTTYVADDHFTARRRASSVPIHSNPLPDLEADQDHILMRVLGDMTRSDKQITESLATDGGRPARDLADDTGYSLSTIYRALQRLDGLVASDNGHVEFVSEKLRQEVREIVATVDKGIDNAAERVGRLVDMEVYQTASSAFERWLAKYGAEFIPPAENGRADTSPVVRIDTVLSEIKSSLQPLLSDVLGEMLDAWGSDGRDRSVLRGALLKANVDGEGIVGSVAANL